jgi:hypothetical protein
MNPELITRLFKEAYNTFPPLEGKPTEDDLLVIWETLLPLLMVIPYDQLKGIHPLTAILTEAAKYKADQGNKKIARSIRHSLSNKNIAINATKKNSALEPRPPINPALTTTPVTRRLNKALPNSVVTLLTRSGTTISRMPRRST